ncbi:biotin transport system substrate-specific component [Conyzicola lurida]|uniref:Biotin transporter n=1 Tax=Conyzicola lurida TaxID=1172621 RepID=A0A841AH22_9MICO|nr:biotin transporter BioY [Conyzicola lurida]MBB5843130.1 biotin transport system substrate-specific component [Conyzicola lurida]
MTTLTLATGRPTLADRLFSRSLVTDAVLITAGAGLTAIAAQVVVPLYPVPITGQTAAVLIVGAALGATRGALAMALYAVLGLFLPVYSEGSQGIEIVLGPTGGYIVGFIFAAALTGYLSQRQWEHKIVGGIAAFIAGTVVTFVVGLPWLSVALGLNLEQTLQAGLYPFLIGGIVKAVFAAAVMRVVWLGIHRSDRRAANETR